MKNQPVLTIAIPIYNGERTIKNMLDILMPQCNEKIEVLVSDNCSTDSTCLLYTSPSPRDTR